MYKEKHRAVWGKFLAHIWFSIGLAATPEIAIEFIKSSLSHFLGIHQFPKGKYKHIQRCYHADKDDDGPQLDLTQRSDKGLYKVSKSLAIFSKN